MTQPRLGQISSLEKELLPEAVQDIHSILRGGLSPGHPLPSPNGTADNMMGTWVTQSIIAADSATTFTHNLGQTVVTTAGVTQPNVVWTHVCFKHNGAGLADVLSTLSLNFETADTVTEDSIQLRLYVGGARTVGAAPNDVTVVAFFIPVQQW